MKQKLTWDTAPETLKVSQAAELCNLHISTVRQMIQNGRLKAHKPTGTHWRILKSDLWELVKPRVELLEAEVKRLRAALQRIADGDPAPSAQVAQQALDESSE